MNRTRLLWMTGVACFLAVSAHADTRARAFELKDQFDVPRQVTIPGERITVLVFADRLGSEQLEEWVIPLGERYGQQVDIHGVASLGEVPRVFRPVVRTAFKRKVPYPVMLDWTGEISEQYDYEALLANVVVIDPEGKITHRVHGASCPERMTQLFERMDALLATSRPRAE